MCFKRLLQIAVPLLVLGVLGGCTTTSVVDVYLTRVTPLPSTLLEQRMKVELRLQNLSENPIQATGMKLQLDVNGRRLAKGVDGGAFVIPRLGETTSTVVVSTTVFDSVRQVLALPERQSFSYAVKGQIFTRGANKRFRQAGEISRDDLRLPQPAAN